MVSGVQLPHAVVRRTSSRGKCRDTLVMAVPIKNPADCEVRGVIRFLQADEILGYIVAEEASLYSLYTQNYTICSTGGNIYRLLMKAVSVI